MLSVIHAKCLFYTVMLTHYAEDCHCAECRCADDCRCAECRYAECRGAG